MWMRLLIACALLGGGAAHAAVVFVNKNNTSGTHNGASWATAYQTIEQGIAAATSGADEVWVAAATYDDIRNSNTDGALLLKADVALYGGFNGTETLREQRNWDTNVTTISGVNGLGAGNAAYSVVLVNVNGATLDGFRITGGSARVSSGTPPASHQRGGGVFVEGQSFTMRNCRIEANSARTAGGGMAIRNAWGSNAVVVEYCTFINNTCTLSLTQDQGLGGALNLQRTDALINACTFQSNQARYGGGIYAVWSQSFNASCASTPTLGNCNTGTIVPRIYNSVFWSNTATNLGGGLYNHNSATSVKHCTFVANSSLNSGDEWTSTEGGGITSSNLSALPHPGDTPAQPGNPTIVNSVVVNNSGTNQIHLNTLDVAVSHTLTFNWVGGDPGFTNLGSGDFRPNSSSTILVDPAGIPVQADVPRDRAGSSRPLNGTTGLAGGLPDRGAFEYDRRAPTAACKSAAALTFQLSAHTGLQINAQLVDNGSNDDGGVKRLDLVGGNFTVGCATVGANLVTLRVTDFDGNQSTCGTSVIIQDDVPPTIGLQPYLLDLDVSSTVTFANLNAGSGDACGLNLGATIISPNTFTCDDIGPNTVTVTIFDVNGNSATDTTTVTVVSSLKNALESPATVQRYVGDTLPAPIQTRASCGVAPYTGFQWFYDPDGFGSGDPALPIFAGPGGHPADASLTVAVGGVNPVTTLDLGGLTAAATGHYRSVATDSASATQPSGAVFLDVRPAVTISSQPVGGVRTVAAPANSISFTSTAAGGYPGYTYEWYYSNGGPAQLITNGARPSGAIAAGATGTTLTLSGLQVADSGNYFMVAKDSLFLSTADTKSFATSDQANLLVTNNLIISQNPVGGTFYSGTNVQLTVEASGGTLPYTYTWLRVPDLTAGPCVNNFSPTCDIPSITPALAGQYACIVTDTNGTGATVQSAAATINVVPSVGITQNPVGGHRNTGGTITFNVTATGGIPPLSHQWFFNDGVNPAAPVGTDAPSFTIPSIALSDAGQYFVTVSDSGTSSATSTSATLTVTDLLTVALTDPTPTGVPGVQASSTGLKDVYTGGSITLSVTASGGTPPYTYNWQIDQGIGFGPVSGTNGLPIYTDSSMTLLDQGVYRCTVSDNSPDPNVSASIVVGVFPPLTINPTTPSDTTANVTQIANFNVLTTGGIPPLTYDWRRNTASIGAPNLETLAFGPVLLANDGDLFDVVVDDAGPQGPVTSVTATLTVTNNIGVNLGADLTAYTDDTAVISALVAGGNGNYDYAWTLNGNPVVNGGNITGADSDTLTIAGPALAQGGTYALTVNDDSGVNAPDTDSLVLSVFERTTLVAPMADVSVYVGDDAVFSVVVASGGIPPFSYDWQESAVSLGAPDQPTLTIPGVTLGDDGRQFNVVVTESDSDFSAGGTVFSTLATLNVREALTVTDPVPATVAAYTTDPDFDLEVVADGGYGPPYTYQWFLVVPLLGPVPAPGFNANPQAVSPAAVASVAGTGFFDVFVVVGDGVGQATSGTSTLEIAEPLEITDGLEDATANRGTQYTWSITVNGGLSPVTYVWTVDDGSKAPQVIPGADGPSYTTPVLNELGDLIYAVTVDDGGGSSVSSSATLSVVAGVPAAGLLGLGLLTVAGALGGAALLRRRRD